MVTAMVQRKQNEFFINFPNNRLISTVVWYMKNTNYRLISTVGWYMKNTTKLKLMKNKKQHQYIFRGLSDV